MPSSATVVADIPNTGFCTYLDETGEAWVEYWYWIEAQGVEDSVTSDPMTGTKLKSFVSVTAEAGHGGTVTGAGTYDRGTKVTLTAVPDSGYAFSYWTGAVESVQNPLTVTADVPKTCTAVFEPLPIAFESVVSGTNGVTLAWNHLAWATHYLLYRGVTSVPSSATVVADLPNTGVCTYLDETGEMEVEYWYWIEAEGIEDDVTSDPMTGTKLKAPAWPDVKDAAGVAAVLAGAADARLAERIATVEEYDAFRAWIAAKGLDEEAVKASAQAWPSYLLGAEGLFENEPVIQIEGFSMGGEAEGSRAAGAAWTVRVTVKDGENAAAVDAEKVAARFEASRQPGDWSEAALLPLTVSTKGKDGDALLFDVTIESGTVAFLRLGSGEAVVVEPEVPSSGAKYLVVDLSAGADAEAYPVTYLDEPPNGGFNTDEYKTTKLVLRRIEAGTFTMGESDCEDNPPHQVTLTKPYYVGLFEVTQKQYELVTGSKPSSNSGDKRPVEWVSWDTIRGNSGWPASSAVSADSFMGRIRARTGLGDFDLPTEAQWEYACRAGTTTTYSYGNSADWNYMWYGSNSSSQTHDVGTTKPNPWGLYDMHGNVWEWCLDWYGTMSGGTNPKGSSSGSYRVSRGGSWDWDAGYCTSSYRGYSRPSYYNGFRLVRTLSE